MTFKAQMANIWCEGLLLFSVLGNSKMNICDPSFQTASDWEKLLFLFNIKFKNAWSLKAQTIRVDIIWQMN